MHRIYRIHRHMSTLYKRLFAYKCRSISSTSHQLNLFKLKHVKHVLFLFLVSIQRGRQI